MNKTTVEIPTQSVSFSRRVSKGKLEVRSAVTTSKKEAANAPQTVEVITPS